MTEIIPGSAVLPDVEGSLSQTICFDEGRISLVVAAADDRGAEELSQAVQRASS